MDSNSNSPLVSVILTSYNYEQYVAAAVRGVLAQTHEPIELIVVDDGSTDRSAEIVRAEVSAAKIPVKTIFKANAGQASAFNAGFAEASGEIVAFLDSDDLWEPARVEKMVEAMRNYPGGAIYQHQLKSGAGLKRGGMLSADLFALWKRWSGGVFNLADDKCGLLFSPFQPTSGLTFPRRVLESILPVPENLTTCADAYLTRTAIAHGPLVSIPLVLGEWRDHGGNAGKRELTNFETFWIPNVLPALNAYYERHDLGLRLVLDPREAARLSAAKLLGEEGRLTDGALVDSVRNYLENRPPGGAAARNPAGELLRVIFSDRVVQWLGRCARACGISK